MRTTLSILFYTLIFAIVGTLAIAFALHLVDLSDVSAALIFSYQDLQMRLMTFLSGLLLVLFSLSTVQNMAGRIQREKTIAFNNPNGPVTVTLSAVEDLIKRLAGQRPEIKDARADVKATKKGIDVNMRIILRTELNIPDFTARLQEIITNKIQDVFGIEETINVRIHVAKIAANEDRPRKKKEKDENQNQPEDITIPYQGIKI